MKKLMIALLACLLAMPAMAQGDGQHYCFKGTLNGKISVEIAFELGRDNVAAGYIYYPKAKNPAPILIVGHMQYEDPYNYAYFQEFQPDGNISGRLFLNFSEVEGDFEFVEGNWSNPKTDAEMPFRLHSVFQMPAWYVESALTPESPDNIAREYGYSVWNRNYNSTMGGNVTFRAAGKNKLHFTVSNCPQNIAEGSSEPGRPAVLDGNRFEYDEVNECHYGFSATFYRRFVVLETTKGAEQMSGCFGMGASFEGIYVKQKQ